MVMLLISWPSVTGPGPKMPAASFAEHSAYDSGDSAASSEVPKMVRVGNDADDLREDIVVAGPRLLPISHASAAVALTGAGKPDTRDDHPPDRPPRLGA
ncbi:hypothetical protein ASF25_12840 [Methylobacterium sp. Leaf100]|nr:hypothetical protein ASF25_12840 [Methylobacterium sp. Leaf100]